MGILPEFQGTGGNALLYNEMGKTALGFRVSPLAFLWGEFGGLSATEPQFKHVEMTQVAETTRQMRAT